MKENKLLGVPTLFIVGDQDGFIDIDSVGIDEKSKVLKKMHVMEGVGHWPHHERPDEFYKVIKQFTQDAGGKKTWDKGNH